jgi:hypothetical protein
LAQIVVVVAAVVVVVAEAVVDVIVGMVLARTKGSFHCIPKNQRD